MAFSRVSFVCVVAHIHVMLAGAVRFDNLLPAQMTPTRVIPEIQQFAVTAETFIGREAGDQKRLLKSSRDQFIHTQSPQKALRAQPQAHAMVAQAQAHAMVAQAQAVQHDHSIGLHTDVNFFQADMEEAHVETFKVEDLKEESGPSMADVWDIGGKRLATWRVRLPRLQGGLALKVAVAFSITFALYMVSSVVTRSCVRRRASSQLAETVLADPEPDLEIAANLEEKRVLEKMLRMNLGLREDLEETHLWAALDARSAQC